MACLCAYLLYSFNYALPEENNLLFLGKKTL